MRAEARFIITGFEDGNGQRFAGTGRIRPSSPARSNWMMTPRSLAHAASAASWMKASISSGRADQRHPPIPHPLFQVNVTSVSIAAFCRACTTAVHHLHREHRQYQVFRPLRNPRCSSTPQHNLQAIEISSTCKRASSQRLHRCPVA